jgi:hypothetical protein
MFSGDIPPHLSKLKYLQLLDLSNNNLTATIDTTFFFQRVFLNAKNALYFEE